MEESISKELAIEVFKALASEKVYTHLDIEYKTGAKLGDIRDIESGVYQAWLREYDKNAWKQIKANTNERRARNAKKLTYFKSRK